MQHARVNGIDIAYRVDGDGAPTRPWLVFAHTLGHDHSMWDAQAEAFCRACNVLRYDLRGHGRSEAPRGDYTLEQMVDDLRGLLDLLSIRHCHFVGLSLGAMVGQLGAVRAPLRISSLVLAGAACRFSPQMQPLWASRIAAVHSPRGMDAVVDATISGWFTAAFFATRAGDVARAVQVLRHTPVDGYVGAIAAMSRADLTARLSGINCPVLVIAGADDRIVPISDAEQILMQIPQARLRRIAGAGHLSNVEQAADFNAALRDFLAGGSDGSRARVGA
jgi:3-oxoadipate enol-lactonase